MDAETGLRIDEESNWHRITSGLRFFRLPVFGMLAGYAYAAYPAFRRGPIAFLTRKGEGLLWPALIATGMIWALRGTLFGVDEALWSALLNGYQHLWFATSLMTIFAFVALLERRRERPLWQWIAVAGIAAVVAPVSHGLPFLGITGAVHELPYFVFGLILAREPRLLASNALLVLGAVLGFGMIAAEQLTYDTTRFRLPLTLAYPCVCGLLLVAARRMPEIPALGVFAPATFAVYLWHPVASAASRIALKILGISFTPLLFACGLGLGVGAPLLFRFLWVRFQARRRAGAALSPSPALPAGLAS